MVIVLFAIGYCFEFRASNFEFATMEENNTTLFLTEPQALSAICLDFRGYGPQSMLFCEVLRTIYGDQVVYKRTPGSDGLWVATGRQRRMQWLAGNELVEFMCRAVVNAGLEAKDLAGLCRKIFQAACESAHCPDTGRAGIRVRTDMENFSCKQCGRCCTGLDYHDGITPEDVQQLKDLGRKDVLEWVGHTKGRDGHIVYRMWVVPDTNRPTEGPCPFLKQGAANGRYICAIHDVKPFICRHYPVSRKHARMTGCPGFE